jgi:hypothetical protein
MPSVTANNTMDKEAGSQAVQEPYLKTKIGKRWAVYLNNSPAAEFEGQRLSAKEHYMALKRQLQQGEKVKLISPQGSTEMYAERS